MKARCPNCGFRLKPKPPKRKRSYRCGEHEYLVGVLAHTQRRLEIFRNAGGEAEWFDRTDPNTVEEIRPANCQGCAETHLIGWADGQWHHACKLRKKCDSIACALFVCATWHRIYGHKRREPQWTHGHAGGLSDA